MRSTPVLPLTLLVAVLFAHELAYGLNVQDDAFISYRYAANLVDGHGLVFNPGEPVEGYTNFLWTLGLAGVIRLGGDPLLASVIGGMLASAGVLIGAALLGSRLSGGRAALIAPTLVALNAHFALEAVQGLETAFFAMLGLLAFVQVGEEIEDPRRFPWSTVLLALAALTRPEGVLLFAMIQGGRLLFARPRERAAWRPLLAGWAIFALVVASHELFRLVYYGQALPNTFYAKTGGGLAQLARGIDYVWRLARHHPMLSAAAALGLTMPAARPERSAHWWILRLSCLGYLVYVAAVGGDFKVTGRFIAPILGILVVAAERFALSVAARGPAALVACGLVLALDVSPNHTRMAGEAAFRAGVMQDRLEVGAWLRDHFPPETVLAIHSSGTIPYVAGFRTIDMWGLSDPVIAHRAMSGMGEGMAGHEKTDFEYVFSRDPDVYVPEEDFFTAEPTRLGRPKATGFDARWTQRSVQVGDKWLNFFVRAKPPG